MNRSPRIYLQARRSIFNSLRFAVLLVLFTAPARQARADVHRYALIFGNNYGHGPDEPLHYAESDANRVAKVLRQLGGFDPGNVVVLQGESEHVVRRTLVDLNDRIRTIRTLPESQALLLVYYSGHADGSALHLGSSSFAVRELAQLVRGSSAEFRILILDACRSGALTRVKGGRVVPAFSITQRQLPGQGMAFLTASAEHEDAQESDAIRSSFFTHALVSGLLGAADKDGDEQVGLEEAYQYARDATVRETSRTFAGTQHPTFHYDFRGQDSLVLTRLADKGGTGGTLVFEPGATFLVMSGSDHGAVVGEIATSDKSRKLMLPPGTYFVRGRTPNSLLEGNVQVRTRSITWVRKEQLTHIEYAQFARKGESFDRLAQSMYAGTLFRSGSSGTMGACWGGIAGYRLDLQALSLSARLSYCFASTSNATLLSTMHKYSLGLRVEHVWDIEKFSFGLGTGGGASLAFQQFETDAVAPPRTSTAPFLRVFGSGHLAISGPFYIGSEVGGQVQFTLFQADAFQSSELVAQWTTDFALQLGYFF